MYRKVKVWTMREADLQRSRDPVVKQWNRRLSLSVKNKSMRWPDYWVRACRMQEDPHKLSRVRLIEKRFEVACVWLIRSEHNLDAHLTDILTPANLLPILTSSPTFIRSLIPHLPSDLPLSSPPTQSEIQSIISSSQWTEAVAGLDAALRTGALTGTMGSLGMSERAGQGVGEFLEEIIRQGKDQNRNTTDDDDMHTD